VLDRRTARRLAMAERQRRDADAQLDRRGRAALQELELAEARRAAERRRRDARRRQVQARRSTRKARRVARRARVRAAVPRWAEMALFVGPICFPMAVAWIGQMQYARTVMGWPLAGAVVFAAGFELSTVYVARLDWKARGEGDNSVIFRAATWMFAALAATMNYWHAADPGLGPNGEAVSYGAMSLAGIVLWELLSTYRHRARLRTAGILPPRRPRFGLARWLWFPRVTHLARLLALRDGHTLTGQAWQAALDATGGHGSVRAAVAALRGGQGPAAGCTCRRGETLTEAAHQSGASGETSTETPRETITGTTVETSAETIAETRRETAAETAAETTADTTADTATPSGLETPAEMIATRPAETMPVETTGTTPIETAGETRAEETHQRPDSAAEMGIETAVVVDETVTETSAETAGAGSLTDPRGDAPVPYHRNGHKKAEAVPVAGGGTKAARRAAASGRTSAAGGQRTARRSGGVKDKMIRYIEGQRSAGRPVTGADLDRRFGTVNYGSRILREFDLRPRT
jgi:hypothetical protein